MFNGIIINYIQTGNNNNNNKSHEEPFLSMLVLYSPTSFNMKRLYLLVIFKWKYFDNNIFIQKSTRHAFNSHLEVYVTMMIHL